MLSCSIGPAIPLPCFLVGDWLIGHSIYHMKNSNRFEAGPGPTRAVSSG
jgi:hypothetical protein